MSSSALQEERFKLREIKASDYHKGYLQLLQQLTAVGEVSESEFAARFNELSNSQDYHVAVIEDPKASKIIATGTLLVEKKFIHSCGKVGHIEDVVVDSEYRGQRVGQRVIYYLIEAAVSKGCYKVILDCAESNCKFYESCGFRKKELQMVQYFD